MLRFATSTLLKSRHLVCLEASSLQVGCGKERLTCIGKNLQHAVTASPYESTLIHSTNLSQIRTYYSSPDQEEADQVAINNDSRLSTIIPKNIALASAATTPVIWTDTGTQEQLITGAIIPFAQQNFLQWLFLPYTYTVMYSMDFLLNYMPWWSAIATTTLAVKLVFFPLIVKQQKLTIISNNVAPETQAIQLKINEAMVSGDSYQAALNKTKLKLLMEEHGIGFKDRILPVLVQTPMFMSIFFLLRGLTNQPVESMATGGILWFENLTVADPLYALPILTCLTMLANFEVNFRTATFSAVGPLGRWGMRSMSLLLFAFVYSFPSAMLIFWTTNNMCTLLTTLLLRSRFISQKLGLPTILKHDPSKLPLSNSSMQGQFKRAKEIGQRSKTSLDIRRLDDIAFKKAGVGPLRKTYAAPPTPSSPPRQQ